MAKNMTKSHFSTKNKTPLISKPIGKSKQTLYSGTNVTKKKLIKVQEIGKNDKCSKQKQRRKQQQPNPPLPETQKQNTRNVQVSGEFGNSYISDQ